MEGLDRTAPAPQSIEKPENPIGALPLEIQFSILDVLIGEYHNAERDGYKYASGVLKFLFVCKTWYNYASRQIYKQVYFGRAFQYFKIAKHLQSEKGKGIRKLVKKVVFELHENQGTREVLDSYVIQTIFKLCRRIRTVDLRCKWVEMAQNTPWNGKIAEAMKVYADPIRFIYNDPASSPFNYVDTLIETNLLSFMKNLQRLDLYIDPNPVKLARKLAQIPVPHMNIRVYLQTDDDGDVDYTPDNELATLDPNAHIVRPHMFFQIVVTNEHLRKLEISSRQYPRTPKTHFSKSEKDIINWINKTDFGPLKVKIYREYPSLDRSFLMGPKAQKWEHSLTKKWLDQYQENYTLLYDHESDEDPSDSEWEQDTHLETRVSNRTILISPPVSQLGDDLLWW